MADYFLNCYVARYERSNMKFSRDALNAMKTYSWPGNIRELEHSIEKAVILADRNIIQSEDLYMKKAPHQQPGTAEIPLAFDYHEKDLIRKALLKNSGNLTDAARDLGISRPTIYHKMKKYGL